MVDHDPEPEARRRLLASFTDEELLSEVANRMAVFSDVKARNKAAFIMEPLVDPDASDPASYIIPHPQQEGEDPLTLGTAPVPGGVGADLTGYSILQIGNFGPAHSTENEYRKAWEANGAEVITLQENDWGRWPLYSLGNTLGGIDLVFWTRTVWDPMDFDAMRRLMASARLRSVPVIGVHLDIWHGLNRAKEIGQHPWFDCDLLFTADGGHPDEWKAAGIEHVWLPPGVSEFECVPAEPDPSRFAADVAFVGSWQGDYHAVSEHRHQLVKWLQRRGARMFPAFNQPRITLDDLRQLYATTKINVGDSCLVGTGLANYWSDRIPETLGRGGFLLHPYVPGIEDHYTDGEHLRLWEPGNWVELDRLIDHYLNDDNERRAIAEQGRAHVLATQTYTVRVRTIVATLRERGMLQ